MRVPTIDSVSYWFRNGMDELNERKNDALAFVGELRRHSENTADQGHNDIVECARDGGQSPAGALRNRVGDIADRAGDVKDRAEDWASDVAGSASERFDRIRDDVGDKVEILRDDFEQKIERIRNWPESPELWFSGVGAEMDKLNSDGDKVVLGGLVGGSVQLPIPYFGVGGDAEYGYQIFVEQIGDEPAPGSGDDPVSYEVTFNKNIWLGAMAEPTVPLIDPEFQAYGISTDGVKMTFASKEEATRAVYALMQTAAAETVHDIGPGLNNPFTNPVADNGNDSLSARLGGTVTDWIIGDRLQPSEEDQAFLQDHITAYENSFMLKARPMLAVDAFNLGLDERFDTNATVTRTVELPEDEEPGRLTYTVRGDMTPQARAKLLLGKQVMDQYELGYKPQAIIEHGGPAMELSMSWDLPDHAFDRTFSNRPVPETLLLDGADWRAPDEVSARVDLHYQKPDIEVSRSNQGHFWIEAVSEHPGASSLTTLEALLDGDIQRVLDTAGDGVSVTAAHEDLERHGTFTGHVLSFKPNDPTEFKAFLYLTLGRDDVQNRRDLEWNV